MAQLLCHSAILLMFVFSTKGILQWLLFVKWWGPGTVLLTVMVHPFVDQPFVYSWPFQYRKYNGRSLHFVFLTSAANSAGAPSSWVKGTQTACPSCLDSSYFDSDGTFFSFSFSSQPLL
jgi:hypothetical protein